MRSFLATSAIALGLTACATQAPTPPKTWLLQAGRPRLPKAPAMLERRCCGTFQDVGIQATISSVVDIPWPAPKGTQNAWWMGEGDADRGTQRATSCCPARRRRAALSMHHADHRPVPGGAFSCSGGRDVAVVVLTRRIVRQQQNGGNMPPLLAQDSEGGRERNCLSLVSKAEQPALVGPEGDRNESRLARTTRASVRKQLVTGSSVTLGAADFAYPVGDEGDETGSGIKPIMGPAACRSPPSGWRKDRLGAGASVGQGRFILPSVDWVSLVALRAGQLKQAGSGDWPPRALTKVNEPEPGTPALFGPVRQCT